MSCEDCTILGVYAKGLIDHLIKTPKFFSGGVIEIIAGREKQRLWVHVEALRSSESPTLVALISKDEGEGHRKAINWTHIDAATVKSFLTFLYTDDYHVCHPRLRGRPKGSEKLEKRNAITITIPAKITTPAPNDCLTVDDVTSSADDDDTSSADDDDTSNADDDDERSQDAMDESPISRPLTPIEDCIPDDPPYNYRVTAAGMFEERSKPFKKYSYRRTLLAHARVYTFAKKRSHARLQKLAAQCLTQKLMSVDCSMHCAASEVVPAIEHIYEKIKTVDMDDDIVMKIVSHFAAINFKELMHDEFEDLFVEGGEFAAQVGRKLRRVLQ